MKVLVTGAAGMIGSNLVRKFNENNIETINLDVRDIENITVCDLGDKEEFNKVVETNKPDRIIHLAALAHAVSGKNYTKEMYQHLNVECANNVFEVAAVNNVPVLFISTVDVFGFQKSIVNSDTVCKPVTIYGKTKFEAEQLLKASGVQYTIFRFSPVYTQEVKRDIQKRIYLKYPNWAYLIGKNTQYEVLSIDKAICEMIEWCGREPQNEIRIIKDSELLNTKYYIAEEKKNGNAKHVLHFPRWFVKCCFGVLRITGKNKYTFLLNKAVNPLRSK